MYDVTVDTMETGDTGRDVDYQISDHAYDVTVEHDEDYSGDVDDEDNNDVDHVYDVTVDTMETLVEMLTIRYLSATVMPLLLLTFNLSNASHYCY